MSKKLLCLLSLVFLLFTFVESGYADDPNLVGWYKLDESSGTVADDSSVKNNDGVVTGATWAPTGGQVNGALSFTGAGNANNVAAPATYIKAAKGTIVAWVRTEGTQTGTRYIFGHIAGGYANRIQIYCDGSNNELDIGMGGSHVSGTAVYTFAQDTWYHVALTWNSPNWAVYVNGANVGGGTYSALTTIASSFCIGNSNSPTTEGWQGRIDEFQIYDRALGAMEIAALYAPTSATNPIPTDGEANVSSHPILSWTPGMGATAHNVYFGTDPESMDMVGDGLSETSYDPGTLQLGTTYYWSVEEYNEEGMVPGSVWSFTTDTGRATTPSPANNAQLVAVNAVLSWSPGTGATSHDVYIGTAPGSLILLQGGLTVTSFDPGGLNPGINYYWRIDEHNAGGVATGSVWNFRTEGQAYNPTPADMGGNVALNPTLSWTPGIASGSQDIYFGTDFDDVNDASLPANDFNRSGRVDFGDISLLVNQWLTDSQGAIPSAELSSDNNVNFVDFAMLANTWQDAAISVFKGNQPVGSNSFSPGSLEEDTTYYWRVDQVKGSSLYKGDVWSFSTLISNLAAFPGAEGWASNTPGGRGGQVIHVTNLNASGPGSLAAACATPGPRIVVFDVSGVITVEPLLITQPYMTIAGQTAPGGGITIQGMVKSYGYTIHDVIIRHVRVRPKLRAGSGGDGFQIGGVGTHNVILDHCSVAWGNDEVIDFYNAHDMSVQWCTIEESDDTAHDKGVHNFGIIATADDSGAVSVHHNLWAHHYRRVPCMAPYRENAAMDFRNNVAYDCGGGLTHDGHVPRSVINFTDNYWKRGPSCWSRTYPFATITGNQYHIRRNYFEDWGLKDAPMYWTGIPSWIQWNGNGIDVAAPGYVPPITTQTLTNQASATALYNLVLAKAGAWPRDRVTLRTIGEVQIGGSDPCTGGSYGRNAPAAPTDAWLMEGLTPTTAPTDTDRDGMPDAWEIAHGLNPNNAADRNTIVPTGASPGNRHKGYTYIEYYINELADNLVP